MPNYIKSPMSVCKLYLRNMNSCYSIIILLYEYYKQHYHQHIVPTHSNICKDMNNKL